MAAADLLRRPRTWGALLAVAALLGVGAPYLYTEVLRDDAPAPLGLPAAAQEPAPAPSATTSAAPAPTAPAAAQVLTVAAGSRVGYRVDEVLAGQDVTAVGRTEQVTGTARLAGSRLEQARFVVALAGLESDSARRDAQVRGRILDVATHPEAVLELAGPVELGPLPDVGGSLAVRAPARLTVRGQTRPVDLRLQARRTATGVDVAGSLPVRFADFGIPDPSIGPVRVEQSGSIEVSLVLRGAPAA